MNPEVVSGLVEALKVSRHEELLHLHLGAGRFHLLIVISFNAVSESSLGGEVSKA